MKSLWQARHAPIPTDTPPPEGLGTRPTVDEIVVGAGLTGLITALLLTRAGYRVTRPVAFARGVQMNAEVVAQIARGLARAMRPLTDPDEGEGVVGRRGTQVVGAAQVDGKRVEVAPFCTHMGTVLTWNDQAQSWDCPSHGSRFDAEGGRLEGPACRNLKRLA